MSSNQAELLMRLDGSGSDDEWEAVEELRKLGGTFPRLLLEKYKKARSWKERCACVYHAMRYAKESDYAVQLGLEALRDKSKVVRYRACELLAYSQRKDLLKNLEASLASYPSSHEDIRAAIDAIESENHHYFVDRDHSGKVTLTIL